MNIVLIINTVPFKVKNNPILLTNSVLSATKCCLRTAKQKKIYKHILSSKELTFHRKIELEGRSYVQILSKSHTSTCLTVVSHIVVQIMNFSTQIDDNLNEVFSISNHY